jgi:hypothetical protein
MFVRQGSPAVLTNLQNRRHVKGAKKNGCTVLVTMCSPINLMSKQTKCRGRPGQFTDTAVPHVTGRAPGYVFCYNQVYNCTLDIILHTTQIICVRNTCTARSRQIDEIVETYTAENGVKSALSASVSSLFSFFIFPFNELLVHTWSENKLFQPLTNGMSEREVYSTEAFVF